MKEKWSENKKIHEIKKINWRRKQQFFDKKKLLILLNLIQKKEYLWTSSIYSYIYLAASIKWTYRTEFPTRKEK